MWIRRLHVSYRSIGRWRLIVHRRPDPFKGSHLLVGAYLEAFCEVAAAPSATHDGISVTLLLPRSRLSMPGFGCAVFCMSLARTPEGDSARYGNYSANKITEATGG
jgi:hypothetical protein